MKRLLFVALSAFVILALLELGMPPSVAEPAGVTPLPPVAQPDGKAGLCYSFYEEGRPYVPLALNAGSRWDRFDFSWDRIETSPNVWAWDAYDALVDDLDAAGMNMVGILLWTPDWAATSGLLGSEPLASEQRPVGWYAPVPSATRALPASPSASSSPPQGLYEEWNDWTTADSDPINYWGRYVYTVTSRYRGQITHWEMWNEPEWNFFWTGSDADYAQLLKVGYQATKAACPECTVLFSGLHYWADPNFYTDVLDIINDDPLAPTNNYFFDVMSIHLYSRSDSTYDVVNTIRNGMAAHVPAHPIWLTETGVPVWNDNTVDPTPLEYDYSATQAEAAAYVIQSYANARAAGVERYFFFRTHDEAMSEYFGLIRNNLTYRPAYPAYQVAATYLVTPTFVTRVATSSARRVTFWGTPRGKVSVLWNRTPTDTVLSYAATLPTATLVNRWGVTETITATGGSYAISLPRATANLVSNPNDYFIGGAPYLVIEHDTTPPTSSLHTLPTTTFAYTIPLSWDADDDAAGVWGVDIQVQMDSSDWTTWRRFNQIGGATSAIYDQVQLGATHCFRIRAWDRAGNAEAWPAAAQSCTDIPSDREVHFHLRALYGDENGNELWDTGELTVTEPISLRLLDVTGVDAITPTVAASWEFTATIVPGDYMLLAMPQDWWSPPPGWMPAREAIVVKLGAGVQQIEANLGLLPHRASVILPVVHR